MKRGPHFSADDTVCNELIFLIKGSFIKKADFKWRPSKCDWRSRYNYLYSETELKDFLPEIEKTKEKAHKTYIFFNNCHGGFAVKNALALLKLLESPD